MQSLNNTNESQKMLSNPFLAISTPKNVAALAGKLLNNAGPRPGKKAPMPPRECNCLTTLGRVVGISEAWRDDFTVSMGNTRTHIATPIIRAVNEEGGPCC